MFYYCRSIYLFYLFNSPQDLRAPSADCCKTLPRDRYLSVLYNASPKVMGDLPPRYLWPKMQNLGRFHTTSDIDHEYLRNESRYPKSDVIDTDSSRVRRKKSGELWSSN